MKTTLEHSKASTTLGKFRLEDRSLWRLIHGEVRWEANFQIGADPDDLNLTGDMHGWEIDHLKYD